MTEIDPCRRHYAAILGPHALEWHRAIDVADNCPNCRVVG